MMVKIVIEVDALAMVLRGRGGAWHTVHRTFFIKETFITL